MRVSFQLDFKTSELRSLALPVDVRKRDSTLIAKALTSETLDLRPGDYFATSKLPGGQRLVKPFTVVDPPEQDPQVVVLTPDPEDASAHEWEEVSHFFGRKAAGTQAGVGGLGDRSVATKAAMPRSGAGAAQMRQEPVPFLSVYKGNVIRRTHAVVIPETTLGKIDADQNRVVQFDVFPTDDLLIAQLVQPGGPVQNMALPVSSSAGASLVIGRQANGEYRIEAHVKHGGADVLLQYSGYGSSDSAAIVSRSVDCERMLEEKMADPIAACVGAYSILRLGDMDRLHDWTSHLRFRFPWLPDGAAIHGEHLARVGKHGGALEAFTEIPKRGLPLLSDGLFYAVERLKLYASRTTSGSERVDPKAAEAVLEELQPFAWLTRRQKPVSTYQGIDVGAPDDRPAAENYAPPPHIDLGRWFTPFVAETQA